MNRGERERERKNRALWCVSNCILQIVTYSGHCFGFIRASVTALCRQLGRRRSHRIYDIIIRLAWIAVGLGARNHRCAADTDGLPFWLARRVHDKLQFNVNSTSEALKMQKP